MSMYQNKRISVVVCTRNRSKLLRKCLLSIVNQSASSDEFEVVVVDNNSSDNTAEVIAAFTEKHDNFRGVLEKKLGLSCARNRGLNEAFGGYVAYIDDDAEAFPDWIKEMRVFLCRCNSAVAFGGSYEANFEVLPPSWLPPEFGSSHLGDREISLNAKDQFISGTNMVFNRELLLRIGGFDTKLGMSGNKIAYGEETCLQIDLKQRGYEIIYLPSMKVKHLVSPEKMKLQWLVKSVYAIGRCSSTTFCLQRSLTSCCAGICYSLIHALRALLTTRNIPLRRKLYYSLRPLISEIGALHEYLDIKFRENVRIQR